VTLNTGFYLVEITKLAFTDRLAGFS